MAWKIYDKTGSVERCEVRDLEYDGSYMGNRGVTCQVESPVAIGFEPGDTLTYRGETFFLYYDPSSEKSSSPGSVMDAFRYNLSFVTFDVYLQDCLLLDYVPYGNDYHFNPLPEYSFIGDAPALAERIQANMDRLYPGEWTISVNPDIETEEANIEIDHTSCWNGLVTINKQWGLNFTVSGKTVKIGYPEETIDHTFYYGKDHGLYRIDRSVDHDESIVTRLYAYGGDRNIPEGYNKRPVDFSGKKNLMLPGYLTTGKAYIDSDNIGEYGVRENVVMFEDIYPSISGSEVSGQGRIDEIVSAELVTESTETAGTFKVTLKNLGFDINDHLTSEPATISMRSGSLMGFEFEISSVEQLDNGNYEVTLNKTESEGHVVPNPDQNMSAGDRFVLLGISMPDEYVAMAEQKLLAAATEYLSAHDRPLYTYDIGVDEIYMARDPNLHDDIKEGMKLPLHDTDLGLNDRVIIQSLKIKEGGDIPEYEITLSERSSSSTIDRIWEAIENMREPGTVVGGGGSSSGGGEITKEEIDEMYLRKDIDDTAKGNIYFERNIGSAVFVDGFEGKGWRIDKDGYATLENVSARGDIFVGETIGSPVFISGFPSGTGWDISNYDRINAAGVSETKYRLEIDDVIVRGKLKVYEMVISQLRGENDNVIFAGMMRVDHYDSATRRIYLDTDEGVMYNPFRPGDILMVQRFGGMPMGENDYNVIKQYELRVDQSGVGSLSDGQKRLDWITFTNFVGDLGDIAEGDVLTRVDSVTDSTRKGVVKVTTIDEIGAPYIDVVYGMKTDPENATKARMGNLTGIRTKNGVDLTGVWGIYGNGAYFENSTYILDNGNTIEQQFTIINGTLESAIGEIRNDMSLEAGNILKNSTFSRDTNYWITESDVSFYANDGYFIYANDAFLSEKGDYAGIHQDGGRNVLRIRNSSVKQLNSVMDIPEREEEDTDWTYSFSFFYRVLKAGTLTAGFSGKELYVNQALTPNEALTGYVKLSKVGQWDEKGDFRIAFTGDILIYGVSLFNDALADAEIRLQTQITQNAEKIALTATKEYVDDETGKIYTKYDSELSVMADDITARVTRTEFDTETGRIDTELTGKINVQAGRIDSMASSINNITGDITEVGQEIDAINGNLTLYVKDSDLDGNELISRINLTSTSATIQANRIDLNGAVTINSLDYNLSSKINNASSDASDALSEALSAYQEARNASSIAQGANSNANSAYTQAVNAINDAASALRAANAAQTSVNNLPGWSKKASIVDALNDSTFISGGYISTSYINTNAIVANIASIGGFTIDGNSLKGSRMTLYPDDRGINFSSGSIFCAVGNISSSSDYSAIVARNTRNSGGLYANGSCIELAVGSSSYINIPQTWIDCRQQIGWGAGFRVEARYGGEANSMNRTFIYINHLPTKSQVQQLGTVAENTVKYDSNTGYLYI